MKYLDTFLKPPEFIFLLNKEFSFPKTRRLLNSGDFSLVFDHACIKVHHPNFLLLATTNALGYSRLGLVIAKKNVRLAVQRNRAKRAIRETFRKKQHTLFSIDAIVLARRGSDNLTNKELVEIIDGLWNRAAKKALKIRNLAPKDC